MKQKRFLTKIFIAKLQNWPNKSKQKSPNCFWFSYNFQWGDYMIDILSIPEKCCLQKSTQNRPDIMGKWACVNSRGIINLVNRINAIVFKIKQFTWIYISLQSLFILLFTRIYCSYLVELMRLNNQLNEFVDIQYLKETAFTCEQMSRGFTFDINLLISTLDMVHVIWWINVCYSMFKICNNFKSLIRYCWMAFGELLQANL